MTQQEKFIPDTGRALPEESQSLESIRIPETSEEAFRALADSISWEEFLQRDHDTILAFEKDIDTDKKMSAMFDKEGNEWIRLNHYRSLADDIIAHSAYEKDPDVSLTAENLIHLLDKYEIPFDERLYQVYQELKRA